MNFIDQLALKSAEFTATNLSDNSAIEQVIRKHKNKDVSLNKEDTISVLAYGFTALYGEIFKSIIVLFISLLFHIFIPITVKKNSHTIYSSIDHNVYFTEFDDVVKFIEEWVKKNCKDKRSGTAYEEI